MIREMGFRKADDFYIALGQAKISAKVVTSKIMHRLKEGESAVEPRDGRRRAARAPRDAEEDRRRPRATASRSRASTT